MDIENILISNKISAGEKIYKYFISYIDDDNEGKAVNIMLAERIGYVKG